MGLENEMGLATTDIIKFVQDAVVVVSLVKGKEYMEMVYANGITW